MKILSIPLWLVLYSSTVTQAAVMMETRDQNNQHTTIYTKDNQARIETAGNQGFLVLDIANKSLKFALHQQKAILDMSDIFTRNKPPTYNADGEFVESYLESKGLGPVIAGYETEEYKILVNEKYCGSAFVSVRAISDTGFKKFFEVLQNLSRHIENKLSGGHFKQNTSTCEQAIANMGEKIMKIGFPLRLTNQSQQITNEVLRITTKATLPANAFVLPADYQPVTASELMSKAFKSVKQFQPEMLELLKNMPPEARQLMLKQLQQMQK